MAKIEFYPISVGYKIVRNKPIIHLVGRIPDSEQICVMDETFTPYFYVLPAKKANQSLLIEKIKKTRVKTKNSEYAVLDVKPEKKSFFSKPLELLKVFVNLPSGVNPIRHELKKDANIENMYEYDIPFARRYLTDKGITPFTLCEFEGEQTKERYKVKTFSASSVAPKSTDILKNPKILAFDIETYNPLGKISDPEQFPIIMISFYGSDGKNKKDIFRKVITWKKFKTDKEYIEFVDGEAELIQRTKEIVEEYSPDILTGYFSDGFDLPYIRVRSNRYKIDLDIGIDYSPVKMKKGIFEAAEIFGICHIDVLQFIRRVISRKLETDYFDLNSVAKEILGKEKSGADVEKLADAWDSNKGLEEYCEYNLVDSELANELCREVLPNIIELIKIVSLPAYDITRMGFSQLVEWYLIKHTKEFNQIIPERPHYDEMMFRQTKTYKGGFVYEPTPGLYENIVVFDFRSLYPSIISSHNISPATLNCDCCRGKDIVPFEKGDEEDESKEKNLPKYWFCRKNKSFIPALIEGLIARRVRVKEILKQTSDTEKKVLLEARSEALKVLANSFYGYMGFSGARWYSLESARSVTAYARHYITDVIEKAKKEKFRILYSDTDSIFISLEKKKEKDALVFIDKINKELPELMELEYEGFYPRGIFISARLGEYGAKKKYALINSKGIIKIKGFEAVRRNWSPIAKKTQQKVIDIILKENDVEKALKFVKSIVDDLKNRKIKNNEVIVVTQLQKEIKDYDSVGPHVAVAQLMKNKGQPVGAGSIIRYIVTSGEGKIRDKSKLVEDVGEGDYDPDYYINHQVIPSVERIFDVLGYDKEDLKESKEQSKLHSYFK